MSDVLKIGLIGLDTSHVEGFAKFLHDEDHPFHVPGGEIVIAYPGGSSDFEMSYGRVDQYTNLLKNEYGVHIVDELEEVGEVAEAVMITSVDGRVHLEQFKAIAHFGKPVFIDKPFTVDVESAISIKQISEKMNTPVMSCSPLRYDESLERAINDDTYGRIVGADCFGPLDLQETQPGLFWYGIHTVEMLYTILGRGCVSVQAVVEGDHEIIVGQWEDGRLGTIRGNRAGNREFGSIIHREKGTQFTNSRLSHISFHARQNRKIIEFMNTKESDVSLEDTIEIVRFIEAANESRKRGELVVINQ